MVLISGVGGNRTLVQTTEILGFYKFSFHLIFVSILAENYTNTTYLQKFQITIEEIVILC